MWRLVVEVARRSLTAAMTAVAVLADAADPSAPAGRPSLRRGRPGRCAGRTPSPACGTELDRTDAVDAPTSGILYAMTVP